MNYFTQMKIKMKEELNLPNVNELFIKENELEIKQKVLENKEKELNLSIY